MKYFLFLFLTAISHNAISQELPVKEGKIFFEYIDSIPGVKMEELYNRSKLWIANVFVNAQKVIQEDNKESGRILLKGIGKPVVREALSYVENIEFTLVLSLKDGKYRAQLYDIVGWPATISSWRHPIEDIYNRYQSNAYIKKEKKREVFDQKAKDKDVDMIKSVSDYAENLRANLHAGLAKSDNW